jgi:hypothetical protein
MCPKDTEVTETAWFPGEEICRLQDVPEWVKRQRKIAKKAGSIDYSFTLAMLQRDCRISKGIKGIDPDMTDKERQEAEKVWLEARPMITEEDRVKMRAKAARINALSLGFSAKK